MRALNNRRESRRESTHHTTASNEDHNRNPGPSLLRKALRTHPPPRTEGSNQCYYCPQKHRPHPSNFSNSLQDLRSLKNQYHIFILLSRIKSLDINSKIKINGAESMIRRLTFPCRISLFLRKGSKISGPWFFFFPSSRMLRFALKGNDFWSLKDRNCICFLFVKSEVLYFCVNGSRAGLRACGMTRQQSANYSTRSILLWRHLERKVVAALRLSTWPSFRFIPFLTFSLK